MPSTHHKPILNPSLPAQGGRLARVRHAPIATKFGSATK